MDMTCDSDLPTYFIEVTNFCGTCNTSLSGYHGMRSNFHIMGNLN